jgi:hypothetical protein
METENLLLHSQEPFTNPTSRPDYLFPPVFPTDIPNSFLFRESNKEVILKKTTILNLKQYTRICSEVSGSR